MLKTLTVLFVASVAVQSTYALTGTDVIKITAGIMDGVIHKDDLSELLSCMSGADQLTDEFESVVNDFKTGGISGYTNGIEVMAQIINELPNDLTQCTSISDDLSKLGTWASIFLHPTILLPRVSYNLLWHYSEINGDIQSALTDWDNSDYFNFGEQVGEALVLATKQ